MIFLDKRQRKEDTDAGKKAYPRKKRRTTANGCAMTDMKVRDLCAKRKPNRTHCGNRQRDVHNLHVNGAWRNSCKGLG